MKSKTNSYSRTKLHSSDHSERTGSRISRSSQRRARLKTRKRRACMFLAGILFASALFVVLFIDSLPVRIKGFENSEGKERGGDKLENNDWQLVLVNSSNPLEEHYTPRLKTVQSTHKVDERIAEYVTDMISDAKKAGVPLLICSSYRSVSRQQELFDDEVKKYVSAGRSMDEALAEAGYGVAVPGHSEHNTGLALDIVSPEYQILDSAFENTDAFKWLSGNAHKYGFILRYPKDKTDITKIKYEPWHYRFVGLEHAEKIYKEGISLEEYVGN